MAIDAWARVDVAVLNKHVKKLTEPIFRKRALMSALRKKGRITFNHAGKKFDWRVRFRKHTPEAYDDMGVVSFPRTNLWKTAELPYRAYSVGESFSKFEKLASGNSSEALIKIVSEATKALSQSMADFFADELYKDGNSTSYTSIHGLESWFGATTASGYIGTASDSYAGLTTTLGTYGGSWTGTWPAGTGDPEYNFWTPLNLDTDSSSWSGTVDTWAACCREQIRFGTLYVQTLQNEMIDLILLNPELYRQFLDAHEDKEKIELTDAKDTLAVGFRAVTYDGIPLVSEYGVPASTGYGLVLDKMELRSMQSQLFAIDEDQEIDNKTSKLSLDFFGNLSYESPAFSIKWYTFS